MLAVVRTTRQNSIRHLLETERILVAFVSTNARLARDFPGDAPLAHVRIQHGEHVLGEVRAAIKDLEAKLAADPL